MPVFGAVASIRADTLDEGQRLLLMGVAPAHLINTTRARVVKILQRAELSRFANRVSTVRLRCPDVVAVLRFAENPRHEVAGFRVLQLLPGSTR